MNFDYEKNKDSDMNKDPFKEYLKESEPDKISKGYAWSTAIGLQAVDGLKTSKYLIDTAIQNIEGKITIIEAQNLINSLRKYCRKQPFHSRQMNIFRFTENCFRVYIITPER